MQKDNYILLLDKLDQFIRKFYFNKLIRGLLYTTALLFAFLLMIIIAENQFYFSSIIRKTIFYSFVGLSILSILFFIVSPIIKIKKLSQTLTHNEASKIIGNHFSTVKDKLINILQLKTNNASLAQAALIEASINQKSLELKPIPFSSAIDLSKNKQYLKYALPPLLLFITLFFLKPDIVKHSSQRIIQNDIVFERPMPFSFIINEDSLKALQFEDYKLTIKLKGEEIPNEIFIYRKTSNNEFVKVSPQKLNNTNYAYFFSNLQEDVKFYFEANGFLSKTYLLDISQKSMITNFSVHLKYPKYLKKKNEILKNTGDISAPFGTSVEWKFEAIATEKINIRFSDALIGLKRVKSNLFKHSKILKINELYTIKTINKQYTQKDSLEFSIQVEKDEFPEISVKEHQDSSNLDIYYYIGKISDDYGLSKLTFNYQIENKGKKSELQKINIPFEKNTVSEFSYYWNIKTLHLKPGDKLSYYFQVWDNDGVNGSKSTKSKWMEKKLATINEAEEKSEKEFDEIKKNLYKSIEKAKELQEEMKLFKEKMLNKKELSWEDKKQMKKMLSEQKNLQKEVSKMNEKLQQNIKKQSEYKEIDPEIAKKQVQVQKLFDEVLDEEMKKLIEKYEKMMEELNKENAIEQAEEMEITDEELEKELDRMLEMLKKMEFEQKMQETKEKLEKLAEKQEKLADNKEKSTEEKIKEQEELNKEFEKIKEDIEKLDELDKELGDKADLEDVKKDGEETSEEMNDAKDKLSKNKDSKASESQKSAAKKMKAMAEKLSEMAMSMQAESMEEDIQALRQLLENLISLSFEEEFLFNEFKKTRINTPKYISLIQKQHKLIENSELVEDSLFALAKRVIEIESFITDKIFEINRNLDAAIKQLEERVVRKAVVNQQYVMTGYNDLALMLSEVMQQMQQQMAQQMPGNQSCEKPGEKSPKPSKIPSLKQMQQQLSDQISKMGEQNKSDKTGKKLGESKQLAKMAAKQQAIRKALQKIKDGEDQNKEKQGNLGDLQKIIDEMKQNETDLVNKDISSKLIKRQQEILTRLLEADNAEKQRDEKEERKSETVNYKNSDIPPDLKKYLQKRKSSLNLFKYIPPTLKPYYKNISEKYFYNSKKN